MQTSYKTSTPLQFKKLLILLWFSFTFLHVFGQFDNNNININVQHWSTKDGLSHRNTRGIHQDSQGFMWIGTAYGLNRFDGHQFKAFSKEKDGLATNEIVFIEEDQDGWLWLTSDLDYSNNRSISFINIYTYEVVSLKERFGSDFPLDINDISSIKSDVNKTIYFSGNGKIFSYKNQSFKLLLDTTEVITITDIQNDTLLGYKKITTNQIEAFKLSNKTYNTIGTFNTSLSPRILLFYDKNKNIWLATHTEIYRRRKESVTWEAIKLSLLTGKKEAQPSFIIFSQEHSKYQNLIWIKDKNNLVVYHPDKSQWLDIGTHYPEISKANIKHIYFDIYDNAWVITAMGIYKIRITENHFKNYLNQPLDNYNIKTTFSSRGITMMDGKLWVNSVNNNQYLIDLKQNEIKELPIPNELSENPMLFPITKDEDNNFYTSGSQIITYKNGIANKVYYWKKGEPISNSWSIFKNEEKIWLGLWERGLATLEKDSIVQYKKVNAFKSLSHSEVYHFYKWNNKHILLATSNGIFALHTSKGIIQRFWTGGSKDTYIPSDRIYHLTRDKENDKTLWVATAGSGLLKLNLTPDGLAINNTKQFTVIDGLPHNVLYAVYHDDYQNLWIPSDYGLIKFNKETNTSKGYTIADGLPINEFNRISHYKSTDGTLFFGTINGVTAFHPKDLVNNNENFDKPLRITQFQQFNGDINELEDRTASLALDKTITVKPKDKFLILKFALLEFSDPTQIKYSYQITGQDKQWNYLNDNELRLSGLPYGKYTLKVRAQGNSGQFSSQALSIPISVEKPFYLTWWFLSLIVIGVGLGFYFWYTARTKALLKRQKELEHEVSKRTHKIETDKKIIEEQTEALKNLDKMKSKFFANVSHELRTPLTLILAPIKELLSKNKLDDKSTKNLQIVEKNSRKLQEMVNEILDLSKLESSKMAINNSNVHWLQFLKQIFASFESLANMKGIQYQFEYDGNEDIKVIIDKQKVETILNNLLSNAFKFTPKDGNIYIKAIVSNQNLVIEIIDNGRGIAKEDLPYIFDRYYQNKNQVAEGGTGIGLALSKQLSTFLKGNLTVKSELGQSTSFKLQLPLVIDSQNQVAPISNSETEIDNYQNIDSLAIPLDKKALNTILLVEDNEDLSFFMTSILSEFYNVIAAVNGKEALHKLSTSSNIDLIISDVMMPVMDGFQLLKQLKTSEHRNIPVIMLTARASLRDKLNALRIGVDDYLTKPFIKEELLVRIDNLLQNAQGRKDALIIKSENTELDINSDEPITYNQETQKWLDNLEEVILKNIEISSFNVGDLAEQMFTSKRQLYRKIQEHIGQTPLNYIKTYKLNHARELLETKKVTSVKSASYSIGYSNVVYFRREFKKVFGRLPSDYLKQ